MCDDYAENLYIENYHKHDFFSNTSTPDSAESIENYALQTVGYKGKCLFSGNHGNQGNQFEVYKVAEKYNLRYRHSVEAYWVKNRLEKDKTNSHIVLLAKNEDGRRELNDILS
jgi:DNA polymerase III alpha subunit